MTASRTLRGRWRLGRWLVQLAAITGVALLVLAVVVLVGVWEGDLLDVPVDAVGWVRSTIPRMGAFGAYILLYAEESGVPLPAPGDVFVMYAGAHLPRAPAYWVAAWLGLIAVVVLGATNLYLLARHFGRRLVHGRLGRLIHLTPERLDWAEGQFRRWGVLAIIFGRHVPGLRVPITVAAGVLGVRWVVFAPCVAVSTAVWAGAWLAVGIIFGDRVRRFLNLHQDTYWVLPAVLVLAAAAVVIHRLRARRRPAGSS